MDAAFAAMWVSTTATGSFESWVFSGITPERARALGKSPPIMALVADVARSGKTVRLRDVRDHVAFAGVATAPTEHRSFLGVPIAWHDDTLATLYVTRRDTAAPFSELDERFLALLGQRAARVIEISRLSAEVRAAVHARDNILAIVSHDLRSPLSAIQLSACLISRSPAGGDRRSSSRSVAVIMRAAERMNRLIEDLLQASTIEAGTFTVRLARVDAPPVVDEVARSMGLIAEKRDIRVSTDVASDLPPLHADRDRLIQVLSNLLGNAVKFARDGGTVSVRAWTVDDQVSFAVTDGIREVLATPGVAYLAKPIQVEALLDAFARLHGLPAPADQVAGPPSAVPGPAPRRRTMDRLGRPHRSRPARRRRPRPGP